MDDGADAETLVLDDGAFAKDRPTPIPSRAGVYMVATCGCFGLKSEQLGKASGRMRWFFAIEIWSATVLGLYTLSSSCISRMMFFTSERASLWS